MDTVEDMHILEDSKKIEETTAGITVVMKIGESVIKIPKNEMNLIEGTPDSCNQFFETAMVAMDIKGQAIFKHFMEFTAVLSHFLEKDGLLDRLQASRESGSKSEGQKDSVPPSEGKKDHSSPKQPKQGDDDVFLPPPIQQLPSLASGEMNI